MRKEGRKAKVGRSSLDCLISLVMCDLLVSGRTLSDSMQPFFLVRFALV